TAAPRPCCAATTAPNSPAPQWPTGPANVSACPSSRPANPGATATSNRSTAKSATNASTSTASGHWPKPASSSATGSRTTTTDAATPRSATRHQRSTLPPAPTNDRLSHEVDQFSGSGHYNHRRRHSALGYQAPAVYAAACTHQ